LSLAWTSGERRTRPPGFSLPCYRYTPLLYWNEMVLCRSRQRVVEGSHHSPRSVNSCLVRRYPAPLQ
jgi:hypothetical protein